MMKTYLSLLAFMLFTVAPAMSQTCRNDIPLSTPDGRFVVDANGAAQDTATGLTWKRCSEGQAWNGTTCNGSATQYTWQQAMPQAEVANFAGQSDWRLPNIKELFSLLETRCSDPSINTVIFPGMPSTFATLSYWSSSPWSVNSTDAWIIHFGSLAGSALVNKNTGYRNVRLVRGGPVVSSSGSGGGGYSEGIP